MSNHFGAPEQAFEAESRLPANCFTAKRFGQVAEGIELSFNLGPNQANPWSPHVKLGGRRLQRDNVVGCAYKVQPNGIGLIRRAELRTCNVKVGGKDFYTLATPDKDKSPVTLVKVDLRLPGVKKGVVVKDRLLSLYSGSTGGLLVEGDGYEAVVKLVEGEKFTIFFEDGAVRRFIREGKLVERMLSTEEQLTARIDQAWSMLDEQVSHADNQSQKTVVWILRGMVDLVNLTAIFDGKGEGQALRLMLLRDFFLKLSPELMELVHRKLVAALYQTDSALVDVLHGDASAEALPEGVADLNQQRRKQDRALRESWRQARQLERSKQGPAKGSTGGSKKVQCSNPKVLAKRERKLAQRR